VALTFAVVGTAMLLIGCVQYWLGNSGEITYVGHNGEEAPVFSTFLWQFGGLSAVSWMVFGALTRRRQGR
jgi:hypothetical protein